MINMKINQAAVNPQANVSSREVAEKAAAAEENRTGAVKDAAIENDSDGVTLTVSQRNVVDVSENREAQEPVGGVSFLLEQLMATPEDTSGLHANLSPERVLQLLA